MCACSGRIRFPVGCPTQRCPAPMRGVLPLSRFARLGRECPVLFPGQCLPQSGRACHLTSRQETRNSWSRVASARGGSGQRRASGECAHFSVGRVALGGPAPEKGGLPLSCFPRPGHGCFARLSGTCFLRRDRRCHLFPRRSSGDKRPRVDFAHGEDSRLGSGRLGAGCTHCFVGSMVPRGPAPDRGGLPLSCLPGPGRQ